MYVGHIGAALAGKGLRPQVPLWLYLTASFSPDVAEALLIISGLRPVNDLWSHAVPGVLIVAPVAGMLTLAVARDVKGAGLSLLLALSHVLADLITSRYVLWRGGPELGLDLYSHALLDFTAETLVSAGGWWIYRRSLPPARRSTLPVWLLLAFLVALQAAFNFMSGAIL